MRIEVVDTETTGAEETDQVVEVASVQLRLNGFADVVKVRTWSSLFRPTVPVSAIGRAAHHITDAELARAKTVVESLPLPIVGDVIACHNAEFDLKMLTQSGVPREALPERVICTWRCSMHLFPDAPRHSNQVLRYHLGFEPVGGKSKLPPHRALPDAQITAGLLVRMMRQKTPDELVKMTKLPVLLHTVRFGKYRGQLWETLDEGYLHWILSKSFGEDEKYTAQHWISKRREEKCQEPQASVP